MKTLIEVLNEAIPGILSTVISTLILLILKIISNSIEIIVGLYLLFLVVVTYMLYSKQQCVPLYIKRARPIIVVTLIVVPLIFSFNYNSARTIPDLQIELINNGSEEIHISNRGGFYLTALRTPLSDQLVDAGKIKLKTSDKKYQDEFIIYPKGELIIYAQVINPVDYLALFKRGDIDMQLTLNQVDGKMITMQGIPFDRETFSTYCIPYEIEKTHEDSNTSIL